MSEKSEKKRVTFSAEPDEGPDDSPLPDPGPIQAIGIVTQSPPADPAVDPLTAQANALIDDIDKAQNPRGLADVKWVQFVVAARMSGKSSAIAAISATQTSRLLYDHERGTIIVCAHGTIVPLSNVAAFGLAAPPS